MKRTLVIGSTVADVIISVPRFPKPGGDVSVISEAIKIGGCAFNVSEILRITSTPYTLCSPVGSGIYGEFVANELKKRGIPCFKRLPSIPNGCCYCIVDTSGERTFFSNHGAEYLFSCEWINDELASNADSAYVCGIELEEPSGKDIIRFLENHRSFKVFFALSSRVNHIPRERLASLFALRPITHLNESEALKFTGEKDVKSAALALRSQTQNAVIITLGEKGAYCLPKEEGHGEDGTFIAGVKTRVKDTIGAGDAHFGAVIAFLKRGTPLNEAVIKANKIAAAVVSVQGAGLDTLRLGDNSLGI